MDNQNTSYPGHDEGTKQPTNAPGDFYQSPATHAELSKTPSSVNTKSDFGKSGETK